MSKKKAIKTQFGTAAEADFSKDTWTFEMKKGYEVVSGEFAIVDKMVYDKMIVALDMARMNFERNRTGGYNGLGFKHEDASPYLKVVEAMKLAKQGEQ